MKRIILISFWLLSIAAYGQGSIKRYDTLTNLLATVKPSSIAVNNKLSLEVAGYLSAGDWGPSRVIRWDRTSTASTNLGTCFVTIEGVGRWIFDDCYGAGPVSVEWFGGKPDNVTGYTNRNTWQSITRDSRAAAQGAIDFVSGRGGGVVRFGPGDWRFGDSSNPGTIFLKPNVTLEGTGIPMGDDALEGTFASTNLMRTMHNTVLHFSGGLTNGYGAPCIALIGNPSYTNQYYTAFTDVNSEWVAYYRGGNTIRNLGIYSGWKWAWNNAGAPAAAIYINEVAGTTIDNVWIGPTSGPGIYLRGAFGTRILNSVITTPLSSGIVFTDTSDTIIDNCTISATRGASIAIHRANTHIIRNCSFWNNAEDLVGWVGTSASYTNFTTVESVAVRRTGFVADATTDLIGVASRIGSDSGMPVMVKGTSLPGGLDTNTVYYVRWATQGGTNFYLTTSSGRALSTSGTVVNITSSGTPGSWWLEGPSSQIWLRDMEEAEITSLRADQSFSGIIDALRVVRSKFANIHAWEIGLNQTEVRQSRKQTFEDPNIVGIRLEDCHDITISGGQFVGSKANTSLTTAWDHNGYGVYSIGSADIAISGNTFDRLSTAIYADGKSANISTDGNQFGGWVSRAVDSDSGYGITQHAPYFDGRTNSQIVASVPAAYTNITGDFAVAIKARVPSMTTNGWANGRHSALFNLSTVTNVSGQGALQPRCVQVSFYRSILDNSMNVVATLGGTNYDQSNPSTERFAIGAGITRFIGQDVEIVVQRSSGTLQVLVDGFLLNSQAINNSATGTLYAPYVVVGQFADSGQYSHPQSPIYSIAYHQQAFTTTEINKGIPWARKSNANAILYWDFAGASLAQGVFDLSGNGVNGTVQQIGAVAPSFGLSRDLVITSGSGVTATRTGKNSYAVSATMDTEAVQDVVGGLLSAGSNIGISYNDAGNSLTISGKTDEEIQDLIAGMLVAGTNVTITYNDAGNSITIASSGGGGGGTTNGLGINGSFRTDWNLTNGVGIQFSIASTTNASLVLANRDWGDVTVTGNTNITIDAQAVTYADIQNISAASRLLGRGSAAGAGSPQEISLGTGLSMSGTTLSATSGASISTNGGNSAGLPVAIQPDYTFGTTNSINISTGYVGTIVLTNAITVDVGGTGDTNLTAEAILVGNGTSAIKEIGPTANRIAGWNGTTAAALQTGVGITNTGGVVSANLAAGSNVTLSTNANGQVSIAASGGAGSGETNTASNLGTPSSTIQGLYNSKSGVDLRFRSIEAGSGVTLTSNANTVAINVTSSGSFTVSTNNLGYLARSAVSITNTEAVGELPHYTITIPANILGVDGDELEIHVPGTFNAYTTGTNSAYTTRWSLDSASGGPDNMHVVSMSSTYFTQTSTDYSLDWLLRVKRLDSNTVFATSRHMAGPHYDSGSTNLQVSALGSGLFDISGNLGTDPIDITLYTDIVDDTRAARLKTFGYLVGKVGSLGQTNFITSTSSDFQVSGGALSVTNTTGTGRLVRESVVGGALGSINDHSDVDASTPSANSLLVYTGTTWTKTNSPTIDGTVSVTGTNYAMLFLADGSSSTNPPGVTLQSPPAVQTNYSRTLASNATPGLVSWSATSSTNVVEVPVSTSAGLFGIVSDETGGSGVLVGSASPAFTGSPTAPTASSGTSNSIIATTAFVASEQQFNGIDEFTEFGMTYGSAYDGAPWYGSAINSGLFQEAGSSAHYSTNHPSVVVFTTSASANSGGLWVYGWGDSSASGLLIGGGEWTESIFRIVSTNDMTFRFGFVDTVTSAQPVDGVSIAIGADGTGSTFGLLQGQTSSNSIRTVSSSSYAVATNTWYRCVISVDSTASSAVFQLYDFDSGSMVWSDTNSANIPVNRNLSHMAVATATNTVGSQRLVAMDYMRLRVNRNLGRTSFIGHK